MGLFRSCVPIFEQVFESFRHLTKIGQFCKDFWQFYLRQKPHNTRLFAFKALKNPHFSGMGSNRRFFGFWEEKWIDWEEKMIEGNTPKNGLHTDKIMFEVYQMKYQFIDWDSIPDVINKDQFYQICHISKSTALHLLKSGKVPCEWTGKKTRCYKIKKEDVKEYLQTRAVYPELYSAPSGWYGNHYVAKLSKELPEEVLGCMHAYYSKLLKDYNDVLTVKEVMDLTGYAKTTINNWCNRGQLKSFRKRQLFYIPKIFLVDFFCSLTFRSITRKSMWHVQTLNDFQRKMKQKR